LPDHFLAPGPSRGGGGIPWGGGQIPEGGWIRRFGSSLIQTWGVYGHGFREALGGARRAIYAGETFGFSSTGGMGWRKEGAQKQGGAPANKALASPLPPRVAGGPTRGRIKQKSGGGRVFLAV